jgi:hypothetical protein
MPNVDGSGYAEIALESPAPTALAIDVEGGKLYWGLSPSSSCGSPTAKIQRSNLDGSAIENVVTGLMYVSALAVDHGLGKIYWGESCGVSAIKRANLDGSTVEPVVSGQSANGIALNPRDGTMYWTQTYSETISKANLDGTDAHVIIPFTRAWGIALLLPPENEPADLDGDGNVDGIDLALLLGAWGPCPKRGDCDADLNGDGIVNGFDLAMLLAAWT